MKYLISFADNKYKKEQSLLSKSALKIGGFDAVIDYGPEDIDEIFKKENEKILQHKKGYGYWLWKPYFISKALRDISDGDYLFYCDSACYFIRNIENLIQSLEKSQQSIMAFESGLIEIQYTKKLVFELMDCENENFKYSPHRIASFILIKKTKESEFLIHTYLELAKKYELITDSSTEIEDPLFIEHRHDQSIWSLLTKKFKLDAFRDPSQFGFLYLEYAKYPIKLNKHSLFQLKIFKNSDYPITLIQYRIHGSNNYLSRIVFTVKLLFKLFIYHLLFRFTRK
jgi:hypothetical protein